jgi:hypothetical protein
MFAPVMCKAITAKVKKDICYSNMKSVMRFVAHERVTHTAQTKFIDASLSDAVYCDILGFPW